MDTNNDQDKNETSNITETPQTETPEMGVQITAQPAEQSDMPPQAVADSANIPEPIAEPSVQETQQGVTMAQPEQLTTPVEAVGSPVFVAPAATTPATEQPHTESNAMTLFLQWLTYALWGWVLLPLIWVIFAVVFAMFGGNDVGEEIVYPLAAVVVLLPTAIIMDLQYSKREPMVKKGAALVIMLIHAVIFVLFGIGFLIGAVFSFVNLLLHSDNSESAIAAMVSCGIVALLYAIVAVRTIKPSLLRPGWNNEQE